MKAARPVNVTKASQAHAVKPSHKPGLPIVGPNYVAQRAPSVKQTAGRSARSRKAAKVS